MPTTRGCSRELVRLVCDANAARAARRARDEAHPEGAARGVPRRPGIQDAARAADGRRRPTQTGATVRNDVMAAMDRKPRGAPAEPEKIEVDRSKYETVTDEAALDRWIAEATAQGYVALDTETDCIDCIIAKLAGVSLATAPEPGLLHPGRAQRRRPLFGRAEPVADGPRAREAEAAAGGPGGPQDRAQFQI